MGAVSFFLIPLSIRFILTPILIRRIRKEGLRWEDEESRDKMKDLMVLLRKRLMSSERMNLSEDFRAIIETIAPPDENGTIKLDFSILRALEIVLMGYGDVYALYGRSRLLRYLMNRRLSWFNPFIQGTQAARSLNRNRVLKYLGQKGVFFQIFRLALIPLLGIPGLVLYGLRSLIMRLFWEGTIRSFYLRILHDSSQYLLYLYGGRCLKLEEEKERFSRKEIIRKAKHYDRELSILPEQEGSEELLQALIKEYRDLLIGADLSPDPLFSLEADAHKKRVRARKRVSGFFRKTINAIHGEIVAGEGKDSPRQIAAELVLRLSHTAQPGSRDLEYYRPVQLLSAAYKLSIIALGAVYSNAPGSRFAMEKMSVDLFRKVREFSRQPLLTLLREKGMDSWKTVRPILKARQLLKLGKTGPAGVAGLGLPFFGRIIQDKTMEIILYRIGRIVIRSNMLDDRDLPEA